MSNSTNAIRSAKPRLAKAKKPRPDFPLFPDASGRWRKKVLGKDHYFGKVADDPKGERAIRLWLDQKDALLAGRKPRPVIATGPTLRELCNRFLTAKEGQRDAGDIRERTFVDYLATCKTLTKLLDADRPLDDFAADDFEALRAALAKKRNPNTLGNEVGRIRVLFQYGLDIGMLDRPMRFGPTFKRPAKRILRAIRQKQGPRMFEAAEIRTILDFADTAMKAMILLGINAALGNCDCGSIFKSAVDFKSGWLNFPRPKTAVQRRCPLWQETVAALKAAITVRPKAKLLLHDNLIFLTKYGQPWARDSKASPLSAEFRKLLLRIDRESAETANKERVETPPVLVRPGVGFYSLRRTFRTVASDALDEPAADIIMGHAEASTDMAAIYRQLVSDERLQRVSNYVHDWLFRKPKSK